MDLGQVVIVILAFLFACCSWCDAVKSYTSLIYAITANFDVRGVQVLCPFLDHRHLLKHGMMTTVINPRRKRAADMATIYCSNNSSEYLPQTGSSHPLFVIAPDELSSNEIGSKIMPKINEELYLVNFSDHCVKELYYLEDVSVSNRLGCFDSEWRFLTSDQRPLVKRRSDLRGVEFTIATSRQAPYVMCKDCSR